MNSLLSIPCFSEEKQADAWRQKAEEIMDKHL